MESNYTNKGVLVIYDLDKFRSRYSNGSELLDIIVSGAIRIQTLGGKEYLTTYHLGYVFGDVVGYNLFYIKGDYKTIKLPILDMLLNYKNEVFDSEDEYYTKRHEAWLREKYTLEQLEQLSEKAKFLVTQCYLTNWEVWT